MNIIKFKDVVVPDNDNFNNHFKGRYCLWPKLSWAVNFEDVDFNTYQDLEQSHTTPEALGIPFIEVDANFGENELVDQSATIVANSTDKYIAENSFIPSGELTVEQLKEFRTWLAKSLIDLQKYDDDATLQMLAYYSNHMNDCVTKNLEQLWSYFNLSNVNLSYSSCGCGNTSTRISKDLTTGELATFSNCDPLEVYRLGVRKKMIEVFSELSYWTTDFETNKFLVEFKKYIDGIIKCDFALAKGTAIYIGGDCLSINQDEQERGIQILKNLSKSLEYIINGDVLGHKNFISGSFGEWSRLLYEYMEWI